MFRAAVLCFSAAVFSLVLRKDQPALSFLVSVGGAVCLILAAVRQLEPVMEWLQNLSIYTQGQSVQCLLQVLGIALVTQLAVDICREAGMNAAATAAELYGRLLALLQTLPLLQSLVDSFLSFL